MFELRELFAAKFSHSGLCIEASHCVNVNKIIFGSGTKLHVNASKLKSFHIVLKSDCM